jgi:hypothetical protein
MLKKYTEDEYWALYKQLPSKVKDLFWEEDIAERINKIKERFSLTEEKENSLIEIIAHLFLGILPPEHVSSVIQKEIVLEEDHSEKLSNEVIRFIIYPVQHLLREIYTDENFQNAGIKKMYGEENIVNKKNGDVYREPIE